MDILMLSLTKTLGWTFDPCWHDYFKSTPWKSIRGKSREEQRLGWDPDWPTSLQVARASLDLGIIPPKSPQLNTVKAQGQLNIEPVSSFILNAVTWSVPQQQPHRDFEGTLQLALCR